MFTMRLVQKNKELLKINFSLPRKTKCTEIDFFSIKR